METEQKTFTKEEYEHHGEWMFDHGKCVAYQDILKTEVKWSVSMVDRNWDLDTVIIGDGSLKNIQFVNTVLINDKDTDGNYKREYIYTIAKDATVKEIWLAAERSYKIAKEEYEDWHSFLEILKYIDGKILSFFGS